MSSARFAGRTALVTGAAGGIGLAVASRLLAEGARVALADRAAEALARSCSALGPDAVAVLGDLAEEAGAERLFDDAVAAIGPVDILVNNAGVAEPIARTINQSLADWQSVLDVNLRGTFLMSRAWGRQALRRGQGGVLVNVASIVGIVGVPASNAYGTSKAAVIHLTRSLASEWASKGIRVNCVAPGFIEAPMAAAMFGQGVNRERVEARVPMRRLGLASEVAAAVAYLASDDASYVTGAVLPVDGGWCAYGGP